MAWPGVCTGQDLATEVGCRAQLAAVWVESRARPRQGLAEGGRSRAAIRGCHGPAWVVAGGRAGQGTSSRRSDRAPRKRQLSEVRSRGFCRCFVCRCCLSSCRCVVCLCFVCVRSSFVLVLSLFLPVFCFSFCCVVVVFVFCPKTSVCVVPNEMGAERRRCVDECPRVLCSYFVVARMLSHL